MHVMCINGIMGVVIFIHSECVVVIIVRIRRILNVKDRTTTQGLSSLAHSTH